MDDLDGVSEDQRAYGIISAGAALVDDYVRMYLRKKGDHRQDSGRASEQK